MATITVSSAAILLCFAATWLLPLFQLCQLTSEQQTRVKQRHSQLSCCMKVAGNQTSRNSGSCGGDLLIYCCWMMFCVCYTKSTFKHCRSNQSAVGLQIAAE
jgi:hypothetical protein